MKTHQSLLQYLLCWHKHVQYITVPDDWSDPISWCFWSVLGLCKILIDRSAEQETVGMTLRMTKTFPKFDRALWPKKIGQDNKIFGYIYTEITQTMFFHIFSHRCKAYLKPSANFSNILGETFFANIGLQSFSIKFRVKSQQFYFIDSSFHHQITEIKSAS